jgi:5-(carboxyamino)imidazole ribonucleotide synthase
LPGDLRLLPPGSTIGILGGGQLGRMLALAAAKIGLKVHIYADQPDPPAAQVAAATTRGAYDDLPALERFAAAVDVITYEFENVPFAAARHLEALKPVRPRAEALAVAQDRLVEKRFMRDNQIPVAPFAAVDSAATLDAAAGQVGLPAILKTRLLGYDGKGQIHLKTSADVTDAHAKIGRQPAILEALIPFSREISVIAVRGMSGTGDTIVSRCYDCPENSHKNGVLSRSVVPAAIGRADIEEARRIADRILDRLDYVGVLAVEFFHVETPAGTAKSFPRLLVNEIAPRVHNSGHWTMDACSVDQFENHIRAVAGWPLGSTDRHSDVEMVNLIGDEVATWHTRLQADDKLSLHLYGKGEARPGRKMGHINALRPRKAD